MNGPRRAPASPTLSTWGIVTAALTQIDLQVGPMYLEMIRGERPIGPALEEADRLLNEILAQAG